MSNREKYAKTIELLKSMGINGDAFLVDDFDTTGYSLVALDDTGKRYLDPETARTASTRHEWPSLADGIRVIDQFIQEGGTR